MIFGFRNWHCAEILHSANFLCLIFGILRNFIYLCKKELKYGSIYGTEGISSESERNTWGFL